MILCSSTLAGVKTLVLICMCRARFMQIVGHLPCQSAQHTNPSVQGGSKCQFYSLCGLGMGKKQNHSNNL